MKKKLLFLMAALALCAVPFSSCSSEDEPKQVVVDTSVVNTTWKADDGTVFKFYANDKCELSGVVCDYHQIGDEINLKGNLTWYKGRLYHTRYAYVRGNGKFLSVEMFATGEPTFTVVFNRVS